MLVLVRRTWRAFATRILRSKPRSLNRRATVHLLVSTVPRRHMVPRLGATVIRPQATAPLPLELSTTRPMLEAATNEC